MKLKTPTKKLYESKLNFLIANWCYNNLAELMKDYQRHIKNLSFYKYDSILKATVWNENLYRISKISF